MSFKLTDFITVTNTGNVGMGNTSPNSYFVRGGGLVVDSVDAGSNIVILNDNNTFSSLFFAKGSTGAEKYQGYIEYEHANNAMAFGTAQVEHMRISSGGKVGIGTGSTEGKLTLSYTAAEPPTSGTTSNSAIQIISSLNNQLNIGLNTVSGDYGSYIQASDNNLAVPYPLNLQPNGGKLGIGTITPGGVFDVSYDGAAENAPRLTDTRAFAINNGAGLDFLGKVNTAGQTTRFGSIYGKKENVTDGSTAGYLEFQTNDVSRFTIASDGVATFNNLINANEGVEVVDLTAGSAGTPNFKTIIDYEYSNTNNRATIKGGNEASGTNGTYLKFYVNDLAAANTPLNLLTLQSSFSNGTNATFSSNVGIGTTSPGKNPASFGANSKFLTLESPVVGSTETVSALELLGSGGSAATFRMASIGIGTRAGNNYFAQIDSLTEGSGGVGGNLRFSTTVNASTTAPSVRLSISSGGVVTVGSQTVNAWLSSRDVIQIGDRGSINSIDSGGNFYISNNIFVNSSGADRSVKSGGASQIRLSDNEILLYTSDNVPTGADQAVTLTPKITISSAGITTLTNSSTSNTLVLNGTNGYSYLRTQQSGVDKWAIGNITSVSDDLEFYNGTTRLTISSVGNVGIKATPTASSLNVKFNTGGTDAAESVIAANIGDDATLTSAGITIRNAGNRGNKGNASGSNLFKAEFNDATAMVIDKNGNVGIGITPTETLTLGGTANVQLTLKSNDTSSGFSEIYFGDSASTNRGFISYSHSSDAMSIGTAGSAKMRIASAGIVGIGVVPKSDPFGFGGNQFQMLQFGGVGCIGSYNNVGEAMFSNNVYVSSTAGTFAPISTGNGSAIFCYADRIDFKTASNQGDGTMTVPRRVSIADGTTAGHSTGALELYGAGTTLTEVGNPPAFVNHYLDTGNNYSISTGFKNTSQDIVIVNSSAGVRLAYADTSWVSNSDENIKENIVSLDNVLDKIKDIRCVNYNLKDETIYKKRLGFIAQDFQEDFGEVVGKSSEGILGLRYTETIPILMKAIQEQQVIIEDLKSRIETLEG